MSDPFTHPAYRWEPWEDPSVMFTSGPARVVTDDPDPDFRPAPVGFAPPQKEVPEPLTWEGD